MSVLLVAALIGHTADPKPLVNGHSHNDYQQLRPLWNALESGLCSIEADVFLVDGDLLVGHNRTDVDPSRTLDSLYLKPLAKLARAHGGRLYRGWPEVTLLVDIKRDGTKVFPVLLAQLNQYSDIVGRHQPGAFRVVLSGDRPVKLSLQDSENWTAIDGRPADLGRGISVRRMPLVSESWFTVVGSARFDAMPSEALVRFQDLVKRTHHEGRKVRFWGMPDSPEAWKFARDGHIDFLNTDQPSKLRAWFSEQTKNSNK